MLRLQRMAGNRAVAGLIARQPKTPVRGSPRRTVLDHYSELLLGVAEANQRSSTVWRTKFNEDLVRELGADMAKLADAQIAGKPLDQAGVDLRRLEERLGHFQEQLHEEHEGAMEVWGQLQTRVAEETERLQTAGDVSSLLALRRLQETYSETDKRQAWLGSSLVAEDLNQLESMLKRKEHVATGQAHGKREEQEAEADLAKEEGEQAEDLQDVDDDSLLGMAWDLVGWSSPADFAADVALTVFTAGIGKLLKFIYKGKKARDRVKAIQRLRELLKVKRAGRLQRRLAAGKRLIDVGMTLVGGAVREQMAWLRKNWSKVGRKIGTDVVAAVAQGKAENLSSTATRRAAKEYINQQIQDLFDKSDKDEQRYLRLSFAAAIADKPSRARTFLGAYLVYNVRRRLLTNTIYYALIETSRAEVPTDAKILKQIGLATAGECVQDMVTAVPILGLPGIKDAIESLRKYLVKELEGIVTR